MFEILSALFGLAVLISTLFPTLNYGSKQCRDLTGGLLGFL